MGIAKESLEADLEYSAWANRRLLGMCSLLTDDERVRDLGQSHRSVLHTLHHMYESERFWADCLRRDAMPPMDQIGEPEGEPDVRFDELVARWPEVWDGAERWLASVAEEDLAQALRSRLPNGVEFHFARWQLLRHMVNHSTLHRGQIVGMLRAMGKQPPNVDLMSFLLR